MSTPSSFGNPPGIGSSSNRADSERDKGRSVATKTAKAARHGEKVLRYF